MVSNLSNFPLDFGTKNITHFPKQLWYTYGKVDGPSHFFNSIHIHIHIQLFGPAPWRPWSHENYLQFRQTTSMAIGQVPQWNPWFHHIMIINASPGRLIGPLEHRVLEIDDLTLHRSAGLPPHDGSELFGVTCYPAWIWTRPVFLFWSYSKLKKIDMQFTTFPLGLYFSVFSRLLQWLFGSFHFNVSFISSCDMFFGRVFRRLKSNVPRFQVRGFLASSLEKLTIIPLTSWRCEVKADTIYSDWILRLF